MRFSTAQIREAINWAGYTSDRPGWPQSYVIGAQVKAGSDNTKIPFAALSAAPNVALEVMGLMLSIDIEALSPNQSQSVEMVFTTQGELDNRGVPTYNIGADKRFMWGLQGSNPLSPARSIVRAGGLTNMVGNGFPPPLRVASYFFTAPPQAPLIRLPRSVILWGDASTNPLLLFQGLSAATWFFQIQFFCREWPYDTDNY